MLIRILLSAAGCRVLRRIVAFGVLVGTFAVSGLPAHSATPATRTLMSHQNVPAGQTKPWWRPLALRLSDFRAGYRVGYEAAGRGWYAVRFEIPGPNFQPGRGVVEEIWGRDWSGNTYRSIVQKTLTKPGSEAESWPGVGETSTAIHEPGFGDGADADAMVFERSGYTVRLTIYPHYVAVASLSPLARLADKRIQAHA